MARIVVWAGFLLGVLIYFFLGWMIGPYVWLWMFTGWAWGAKRRRALPYAWSEFFKDPKEWWYNYHETFAEGLYPWLNQ